MITGRLIIIYDCVKGEGQNAWPHYATLTHHVFLQDEVLGILMNNFIHLMEKENQTAIRF